MDMQTQGQPPGINGSSHSSSSPAVELRTRWQTDGDVSDRRIVLEHIMRLFQKRKSHVTPEWQQKLPDFVKRLEDHLYRDATSKDEYKDLNTLEPRLQAVARRMATARNTTTMQRPSTSSAMRAMAPAPRGIPAMIPTPGARSSTMIPTPGMPTDAASAVTTQYPRCSSNGISVPVSASATGASNSYIPQQGLRMVQNGQRPTGPTAAAAMNENGHNYHHQTASVSGKRNPPFVNNRVDSGFIGNGQHSLGVNIGHPSSGFLGQVQAQTQHHVSHMQCDGYLLEAARGQMQKSSMNGNISNGQVSKMIPVPGLPSQVLQQLQSENAQERNSISRTNQTKSGISRQLNTATEQPKQEEDQLTSSIPQCSQGGDGEAASGIGSGQSASLQQKAQQYTKQQKWLLLLRHASKCASSEGQCVYSPACSTVRQLCNHISWCRERTCQFPRCQGTRILLRHHSSCKDARCPVCAPVRLQLAQQRQALQASSAGGGGGGVNGHSSAALSSSVNDGKNSSGKRIKEEADDSLPLKNGVADTTTGEGVAPPAVKKIKTENCYVKSKSQGGDVEGLPVTHLVKTEAENVLSEHSATGCGLSLVKQEALTNNGDKSAKPKNVGISLIELFSPEQIKDHIVSLRQWIGQSKAKAEKNQALEQQKSENACRLCAVERLTFEPPPLYCTTCGGRIKRNVAYYTAGLGETKHFFCVPCFNEIRTDTVELDGQAYPKNKLERKKNDEEMEEAWVQCDKCNLWQHQICALFNGRRNEGGDAEYICPHCCLIEMEKSERKPLPSSSVLGAKDLPKTILSDHLEQRLARRLKQERLERARAAGKGVDEVPGAEGLVIRVVSSVDKKLEVKQRFLELFQGSECPTEFAYKSKVVLLFQKIEGVEVCLFGMYVQEFGAECSQPNNRRVYLSYLDSVKYFRPEVRTVNGEALRTFVYHEILIGYLEYCKKRGFGSCYIWACPPLRGEDYILYCHPEIQKTPKSDKLREWYLTMLRKASADKIVAEVTNFYDYFFVSPDECTADVTAARLPYFDGDYWPGAAEDMLAQLQNEEDEERKLQKKGKGKKVKRAAQSDINSSSSKDLQLMHKLGQTILPMKEDFIMVHIHHTCRRCRLFITSGHRWVCKQCKNYQMCNRCYIADQKLEERDRHPSNSWEAHTFVAVEIEEVAADTKDKDDIMESEFFDTRQAFLSLCQGNHYQHDTLRRAKHSSMMVLYHLHNPTAPAFVTSCNICQIEIETGRGWRCDTCPDFDVCDACHQKDDSSHPHKLTPQLSVAERSAQNKEARQQRVLQLRKMLGLLVHASQCCAPQCQYPKCRSVKGLFRHGTVCRTRASGGCALCKMMWHLLQLHARACKESDCRVPRCKDLKEHLRRLQQQMESRRRAAVKEMIRQRTSGGSSSNG